MTKYTLTVAALFGFLATPLMAQDKTCDEDTMAMVIAQVDEAPAASKDAAMLELNMAKEKMDAGDAPACAVHLTNASTLATGS